MSWVWIIAGAVVLLGFFAMIRWVRLFFFAFAIAATGLLLVHFQTNPGEASAALAAMGGGLAVLRPLRRVLLGGFL